MMQSGTIFHFVGDPHVSLLAISALADVHWILPPLSDGSYLCALRGDFTGAARAALTSIVGVTILPSRYATRTLNPAHVLLMKGLLDSKIGSPTMYDVLAAAFKQNPHPIFDPDA